MKLVKTLLLYIGVPVLVAVILTVGIYSDIEYRKYIRYEVDYAKRAELKYQEVESKLIDEIDNVIHKKAPNSNLTGLMIAEKCLEYNISIRFVLAQTQLESNYGTEGLAAKTNSAWNYGAFDGKRIDEILGIYKYSHPDLSIEPYLRLLKTKYLVNKIEEDLLNEFVDVNGRRYATSPGYEKALRKTYDDLNKTSKLDSLQNLINYWAIRSNRK